MRRVAPWILFAFLLTSGAGAQTCAGNLGGPFELTDHNGKPFSSSALAGQPYAIFFGYTNVNRRSPGSAGEAVEV